jgi:DNA replication factor GINS
MVDRGDIDNAVRAEKETSKLCALEDDFYQQARRFLLEVCDELKRCEPDSSKYKIVQRELENARSQLGKLFEMRMWKLLKKTALLRGDEDFDTSVLTFEERKAYYEMKKMISSYQQIIHGIINLKEETSHIQSADSSETDVSISTPAKTPEEIKEAFKGESASSGENSASKEEVFGEVSGKRDISEEYIVVRAMQDIPRFRGIDMRDYALAKGDVAVLPSVNAEALCRRNIAVKINIG